MATDRGGVILSENGCNRTKTAAGELVENTKAFGIIILKELGKLFP